MATAPSPNDLTRQQLDELDALLQRMLSLPLTPAEGGTAESPAPPPAAAPAPTPLPQPVARNWRVDPPSPAFGPAPHLIAAPVVVDPPPMPPEPAVPAPAVRRAAAQPEAPPAPAPVPAARPQPAPQPQSVPPIITRPAFLQPTPAEPAAKPAEASAWPPVYLWPLVVLNWVFDRLMGLFGPPGELFRTGFGKTVLGLAGIALLVYTAAHVAQESGWVTLPVQLPWPR